MWMLRLHSKAPPSVGRLLTALWLCAFIYPPFFSHAIFYVQELCSHDFLTAIHFAYYSPSSAAKLCGSVIVVAATYCFMHCVHSTFVRSQLFVVLSGFASAFKPFPRHILSPKCISMYIALPCRCILSILCHLLVLSSCIPFFILGTYVVAYGLHLLSCHFAELTIWLFATNTTYSHGCFFPLWSYHYTLLCLQLVFLQLVLLLCDSWLFDCRIAVLSSGILS